MIEHVLQDTYEHEQQQMYTLPDLFTLSENKTKERQDHRVSVQDHSWHDTIVQDLQAIDEGDHEVLSTRWIKL